MDEIVESIKHFRFRKEISKMMSMHLLKNRSHNVAGLFRLLYERELISKQEFFSIETKILLHRFCDLMERKFQGLLCAIYIYDENEKRLWNAAGRNVPQGYNEYTHGKEVEVDIQKGNELPVYLIKPRPIHDVERTEKIIPRHQEEIIRNGIRAFCCIPLLFEKKTIGHMVMYSKEKRIFTMEELTLFTQFTHLIGEQLVQTKGQLISFANQKSLLD